MSSINQSSGTSKPAGSSHAGGLLPIVSLLFAATLWGLIWYPLRSFEAQGLQGLWSSTLMYCGTLIVAIPVLYKGWREWLQQPWLFFFMAIVTGWTNVAVILALLEGNVVRVLLLFYLSPIWATLLGYFFLGEQLSRRALLVLILAMLGAVIMLWDESLGFPAPQDRADWLALSSGITFAVTNVLIHKLHDSSVMVKTATGWLGVFVVAFILIFITGEKISASADVMVWAFLLGATVMTLMNIAVVYGVTHMPVHRSAIILLFEIVVAAISSILLTNEIIHLREWTGGGLVIIAAYLTAIQHVKKGNEF